MGGSGPEELKYEDTLGGPRACGGWEEMEETQNPTIELHFILTDRGILQWH